MLYTPEYWRNPQDCYRISSHLQLEIQYNLQQLAESVTSSTSYPNPAAQEFPLQYPNGGNNAT